MDEVPQPSPLRAPEVFLAFLRLGLTAFGGPVAHLGYFRREFVERRAWLSEGDFANLLALCHFLPGPASSQLGMAIGLRRAGLAGALAAAVGFLAPAGVAMIVMALFQPRLESVLGRSWLHGLEIAASAIVLQALVGMARNLAAGPIQAGMAVGAAIGLILAQGPAAAILALAAGALFGFALLRESSPGAPVETAAAAQPSGVAVAALSLFALLLALLPLAATGGDPLVALASVFYRAGALVFGGGHVVLPLLNNEIVGRGWLDRDTFLAGYGAAQALPGPLFSFAGFVGAAQDFARGGWTGGLVALGAIFLPGFLLIVGVAPFWDRLRREPGARGAVMGANAVVVGLLAAALWNPVLKTAVERPADWALVGGAYIFLAVAKLPPWLVVIGFAAAAGLILR